jgi:DNA-binding CsgD family transcriptional regulator
MSDISIGLWPSSPRSTLLAAYNFSSHADFSRCLQEIDRIDSSLTAGERLEASLLRARTYLRLDQASSALSVLDRWRPGAADVDASYAVEMLRGVALISGGDAQAGQDLLRRCIADGERKDVALSIRVEALYNLAFGHWIAGAYDEADRIAARTAEADSDIVTARAVALRGWIRVGRAEYRDALGFFREASRLYSSCTVRDAAFEASVVHAIATYELQTLEHGGEPQYYRNSLPRLTSTILNTYRLLVGAVDAVRAGLAGDEPQAIDAAIATEVPRVTGYWNAFGLAMRARIWRGFGYEHFARSSAHAAFSLASALDWNQSPAESRLALLDVAAALAPFNHEKARSCIGMFSRIETPIPGRFFGGTHPLQRSREHYARGAVALSIDQVVARDHIFAAASTYRALGFPWRAAEAQLLLRRDGSEQGQRAYANGRAYLDERFPNSHLIRELHDHVRPIVVDASFSLTRAQTAIVQALCRGQRPREIALDRATAVGTVYNQLKEIYRRTGCHSIGEVVERFGRTAA